MYSATNVWYKFWQMLVGVVASKEDWVKESVKGKGAKRQKEE